MKSRFIILGIAVILVIGLITVFAFIQHKEINESIALELANQAVSDYGIIFDGVKKEPAKQAKFASQLIKDRDFSNYIFSNYNYNEVWVAEKNIGEKEIGGKNYNVTVYVYIGLDGRVVTAAKLKNVIPGIISIEKVFNQIPNTVITPINKESCEARGGIWGIGRDTPNATGGVIYQPLMVEKDASILISVKVIVKRQKVQKLMLK